MQQRRHGPKPKKWKENPPNEEGLETSSFEDDPLAAYFGANHNVSYLGDPGESIPEDIVNIIEQNELSRRRYTVELHQVPEGSNPDSPTTQLPFVDSWTSTIPSIEYVAKNHGPGVYKFWFKWRGQPEKGERVSMSAEMVFAVSEKYRPIYKKHLRMRQLEELRQFKEEMASLKIDSQLEEALFPELGIKQNQDKSFFDQLNQYAAIAQKMGWQTGMQSKPAIEWEKVLPALAPIALSFMEYIGNTRQQQSQQHQALLMMLMNQSKESSQQIVDLATRQTPAQQGPSDMMKEVFGMITQGLHLKETIENHGKESIADKIFSMVEGVLPVALAMAQQPKMAGQARKLVEQNPEFQKIKDDRAEQINVVRKFDFELGWQQADQLLNLMGWERPQECPRIPEMKLPRDKRDGDTPRDSESPDNIVDGDFSNNGGGLIEE